MKKLKCKICECEFVPDKKEHYISRDEVKVGLSNLAGGIEAKIYDTFDCPQCGCQNIMGERKRSICGENVKEEIIEEEEEELEEPEVEVEEPIPEEPIPEEPIPAKRHA